MGRKKIKNLGRRRKIKNRTENIFKKSLILIGVIVSIISVYFITKYVDEFYKKKNIESSKIEFYMDIADEASDLQTQINWQDLMAIDLVINDGDLSEIRKKDSLDIAEKFVIKNKDKDGKLAYQVESFESVLNKLKFKENSKKKAKKYKAELKYSFLGNKELNNDSREIKFIKKIEDLAIKNYYKYNILPSITMAQCILESGWGESKLSLSSNNLFGIKADKRWSGESVEVSTSENYNDKIQASFRVYESIEGSINDHGKFLTENKRYTEHGLFEAKHYTTQAQSLENAGYSTKANEKGEKIYADMLINLIRNYNLQIVDNKVQIKKK
ncbi:MAG: glucosaminidase domain-containing protein [Romboutsia sp.]